MTINVSTILVTITDLTINRSKTHKPHDSRRVTCPCKEAPSSFRSDSLVFSVSTYIIFQALKAIHASPLRLMNKQLLSATTDTNRRAKLVEIKCTAQEMGSLLAKDFPSMKHTAH